MVMIDSFVVSSLYVDIPILYKFGLVVSSLAIISWGRLKLANFL